MVQSNDQNGIASRASIEKFDLAQSRQACAVQNILRGRGSSCGPLAYPSRPWPNGKLLRSRAHYFVPSAGHLLSAWFKTIRLVTVC